MPFETEKTQGKIRLKIQGSLSIYEAAALREELLDRIAGETDLELDLGGVTECDTAGLQLLYAARKTARKRDKHLRVVGAPQAVLDTLRSAGLGPEDVI
jgi:anti-sigma B factor antagonist